MKLVKNLIFAGLLVFTITVNIVAGEVQTPAATSPTPSPTPNSLIAYEDSMPLGYPCVDHTGIITAETTDYLFFEALAVLLSVY